jgi:site-specific DNA-methyltransferase (adenine-specific)
MKKIDDKSIDMILADLPYAVTQNEKDKIIPFKPLWEEYERIIKDNGAILLFAQGLFYIDLVISNRKLFKYDLVWDKKLPTGFLNANKMPLRIHEQIAVFYKKLPTYNPQFSEGPQSHSKGSNHLLKDPTNQNYGKYKSLDANLTNKKYPTSIISKQKPHPSVALHRTEKSVECLEWLIKTYTNPGELVLDNCAGSGTTGLACQNSDRKFILIEKDLSYIPVIKKRLFGEPVERT